MKLHALNTSVPQSATEPNAPVSVPGFFSFSRKKYHPQAREWYYMSKVIPEEVDHEIFHFKSGVVHQFYNTVEDTVLYCFHRSDGRWLRLSANQATKLHWYFAKKAQEQLKQAA